MRTRLFAALAALVAVPGVQGADTPAAAAPASSNSEVMDEIVVRGTRLYELRAAVIKAEDRFYALYNDINKVEDFDIKCTMDKPTGTLLAYRHCRAHIVDRVESDEARDFNEMINSGDSAARPHAMDPVLELSARESEYEQNILTLLRTHPELRQLVKERDEAQQRYDRERVKRMKGRIVSLE